MFGRLKDIRRIATRYDRLAAVWAGPSFHVLPIRGSGDSGNVIAPAEFASPLIPGPSLNSTGRGFGFNLKAGLEIPLDDRFSIDAEYKYNRAYIRVWTHKDSQLRAFVIHGFRQEAAYDSRFVLADRCSVR